MNARPILRRMAGWAAVFCLAVLMSACSETKPAPRPMAAVTGHLDDRVLVELRDIPPGRDIRQIVLVDPQGSETLAPPGQRIDRTTSGNGQSNPLIGVGVSGGSSSGIRPSLSIGWNVSGDPGPDRRQRGMVTEIPLSDPQGYRDSHRLWHIEVRYLDINGDGRSLVLPAPAPAT